MKYIVWPVIKYTGMFLFYVIAAIWSVILTVLFAIVFIIAVLWDPIMNLSYNYNKYDDTFEFAIFPAVNKVGVYRYKT